ncbi:MAG: PHP domain-containing protein [Anaerolineaceae bacterium]|nr:PHP domain-containing protein [Anaerolineaceae bacterium]
MDNLIRVEFHCHSIYSRDSLNDLTRLLKKCEQKGIDRLVITDHNTIRGAMRAKEIDPRRVIVGEEILTREGGEILAFFVREEIPGGLSASEAVRRLKEQDAFISLSHPFDHRRHGWTRAQLEAVLPNLDAIEVFNARTIQAEANHRAARFAAEHELAGTVGSDAHTLMEVGRASMQLPPFNSAAELRGVIWQGQPQLRKSSLLVHAGSRFAALVHALSPNIGQD